MPPATLTVAGALFDLLDVAHKGRAATALKRAWHVAEATAPDVGGVDEQVRQAFVFVAERHGVNDGPWQPRRDDGPDAEDP